MDVKEPVAEIAATVVGIGADIAVADILVQE